MVDFRKTLLLLAIIAMVGTVASAQTFQCSAGLGVPTLVRSEGIAELMGDFVMECSGGVPTALGAPVPKVNFRIWLNVNVTSKLLSGSYNEAILAIDDASPTNQVACADSGAACPLVGVGGPGINYKVPSSAANRQDLGNTVANVYQGQRTAKENEVEWLGVPVDPPGTQAVRIIRIKNVRGDANSRGIGGFVPLTITMYISTSGSATFLIDDPSQTVAWVQKSMTFSATSGSFLQCETETAESFCDGRDMLLQYKEELPAAFKVRVDDTVARDDGWTGQPQLDFDDYNTESGWYNPNINDNGKGIRSAGLATQGTQFVAMFGQGSPIPAGVNLWVTDISLNSSCGSTTVSGNTAIAVPGGSTPGWDQVSLTSGVGQAVWEVVNDNPESYDTVYFGVDVRYTANTTSGIPALGTGTVNGAYYPLSTLHTASSSAAVPRFVDDSVSYNLVTINSCATNLLFVYVTNQGGFETGMVVSNTSLDPFGTATQEGPCTINYYGFVSGSNVAHMAVSIPNVPAGHQAVWTLSSGGTVNTAGGLIAAYPGFQGYAIVQCMFQYAHGFAFISDLGATKLAQGYTALVLDGQMPQWPRTGSVSEFLSH